MTEPSKTDSSLRPLQDQPKRLLHCGACGTEYTAKSMTPCPTCASQAREEYTQKTVNDSDLFK